MTKNITYRQFFLVIICISIFTNCKSDKNKITPSKVEFEAAQNAESDKKYSENHNLIDSTNSSSDSINLKNQSTIEITPKEEKQPIQTKSSEPQIQKKPKPTAPSKMPKIEFEELTWNFGEITEGDIIEKKFKFTNTGNAPLEIIATNATCGCTRPTFPFLDIAPGESNEIGVNYNSVGKEGVQNPEVTIESNTIPKITTLRLTGTVKPKPKKEKKLDAKVSEKDTSSSKQ